jgi:tetratricopeptide (TPR) repeat protein
VLAAGAARAGVGFGTIEESEEAKHAKAKEQAEQYYKEGMQALAEGNVERAVTRLLWVAKMGSQRIDSPYPEMAFNALKGLAEQGSRDLAVARELVAGEDMEAGLKELKRISRVYSGLWPAKEAGRFLRELEKDPRFQQALRAQSLQEDLERARALEQEAEALLHPTSDASGEGEQARPGESPPADAGASEVGAETPTEPRPSGSGESAGGAPTAAAETPTEMTDEERRAARLEKLLEAYALYERIVCQGAATESGREADAAMKRLQADAALAARLREVQAQRQAREWLDLAINYLRAGRADLAREYLEKIVKAYPDSPQADEARAFLKDLK